MSRLDVRNAVGMVSFVYLQRPRALFETLKLKNVPVIS